MRITRDQHIEPVEQEVPRSSRKRKGKYQYSIRARWRNTLLFNGRLRLGRYRKLQDAKNAFRAYSHQTYYSEVILYGPEGVIASHRC